MDEGMDYYRQGDVLIQRENDLQIGSATEVMADAHGRLVLAEGEVTGHSHAILERPGIALYNLAGGDKALVIDPARIYGEGGVVVAHEEHAAIMLPPGRYRVTRQREYTPHAIRRVQD